MLYLGLSLFRKGNSVEVLPLKHQVTIGNDIYPHCTFIQCSITVPTVLTVVWLGDYVQVSLPFHAFHDDPLVLQPHLETKADEQSSDQCPAPCIVGVVGGNIRFPNHTASPIVLNHLAVFGKVRPTTTLSECTPTNEDSPKSTRIQQVHARQTPVSHPVTLDLHNVLPAPVSMDFCNALKHYQSVFNPDLDKYHGASGPFQAVVNMGPVTPPQRKGLLPLYSR